MTTTLKAIRQRMFELDRSLGRAVPIASLTTTTAVVTSLATGSVQSGRYKDKFMLRPDAALSGGVAVDRVRLCSNFASSTGTLTHAGTNYADTTATNETLEIHEYEPYLIDTAISAALGRTRFVDESEMQSRSDGMYFYDEFSWIKQPSELIALGKRAMPVLTGNRHFYRWGIVDSSGVLQPDTWTIANNAHTTPRTTTTYRGPYALDVRTVGGVVCTVGQTISALYLGDNIYSLRGQTVVGFTVTQTSVASQMRVRITSERVDGTVLSTTNSSYHTGSGSWEELTASHTVDDAAEVIRVSVRCEINGDARISEGGIVYQELSDAVRIDNAPTHWYWNQSKALQNPIAWADGPRQVNTQIIVRSQRPYPEFNATRLANGLADADETDCPLDLAAYSALAEFYESMARVNGGNLTMRQNALDFAGSRDTLQAQHLALNDDNPQPGMRIYSGEQYGTMRRMR